MIAMENWATKAHEKLNKERSAVSGKKEKAMASCVLDALKDFCTQEPEFAQAVVQSGSFADCMEKVAAGVGSSISDLEAYKKAVQFYFPGAEIQMQLTIDLVGSEVGKDEPVRNSDKVIPADLESAEEKNKVLTLDLSSFF